VEQKNEPVMMRQYSRYLTVTCGDLLVHGGKTGFPAGGIEISRATKRRVSI
jgi:hypothetical protein